MKYVSKNKWKFPLIPNFALPFHIETYAMWKAVGLITSFSFDARPYLQSSLITCFWLLFYLLLLLCWGFVFVFVFWCWINTTLFQRWEKTCYFFPWAFCISQWLSSSVSFLGRKENECEQWVLTSKQALYRNFLKCQQTSSMKCWFLGFTFSPLA